ncbi:MAG: glycosyltransferase family 2 protein [Spirochaetales bacterium]|nr:glycosyltransferase family 2 protein [Spirochaetales bacterium]
MAPIVSIIIPTYNRLSQLQEAVASVRAQSYRAYEIIVVDDGSADGTAHWLKNQDLRFVTLTHTGFPGLVRNRGAEIAHGTYLCFLDSDDVWLPKKLAVQAAYFKMNPEAVICHTREIWLRSGKIISQSTQKHKREGYIFPDALKKCVIGPSTVMIERSVFFKSGAFLENLEIAEDYELWLRVTAAYEVGYIDEPLVEKRAGHAEQLSEKYGHIELFRIWGLLLNISRGSFTAEQLQLACKELEYKCRIYAFGCEKRKKLDEAFFYRELAKQARAFLV